jgi:endonuclease/exonuclease/phosphatase family metal-dependent hydrolase
MKHVTLLLVFAVNAIAGSFTVATYNLEFYIDSAVLGVQPKSAEARRIIRENILALNPDVIALQEIGSPSALEELRVSLRSDGLDFAYSERVTGWDKNLHVAFLSKIPITGRQHHTNESFLLQGRRFHVGRGFGQIEVAVTRDFRVTLMTAHLKSKRQLAEADEELLREEEAALFRQRIDAFFRQTPGGRLVVLGDFNDGISSRTLKTIIGKGRTKLVDCCPAERNGDSVDGTRRILWTHYYAKEEIYSRIDYILISPALVPFCQKSNSYILARPNWGIASDHRPIVARFDY